MGKALMCMHAFVKEHYKAKKQDQAAKYSAT